MSNHLLENLPRQSGCLNWLVLNRSKFNIIYKEYWVLAQGHLAFVSLVLSFSDFRKDCRIVCHFDRKPTESTFISNEKEINIALL